MKIYIAHSKGFGFNNELYRPIKDSSLSKENEIIFPHDESDKPYDSKSLFEEGCDLVIAEVSHPSIGVGIELGWANTKNIPIVCVYMDGANPSGSLRTVTNNFVSYSDGEDLVSKLSDFISKLPADLNH